ncbi:protein-tyrosine phosphatase-like protein [Aspergillus ambiguus]|uniref:putative tyrosine/serine protein phosphatase n=1 Tax=Aspergillus ambiguus TaxID=176160 RepID=UPI003CCE491F
MPPSHPRTSSVDLDSPDRPFDNIINFRDVGRSINSIVGRNVLKEGVLYRSARLDDASERDKRRLTDELHIATVIDLRSSTEHNMAIAKRLADRGGASDSTSSAPVSDENVHLPDLPGVRRCLISLTGKAFERSLVWKLDWWNFFKVLALAASGYRPDAVILVGEQVMTPRGLTGLGRDTLDSSTAELREILELFAAPDGAAYPVLVHCTQGKDRTGLVILLLLLLTGAVAEDALAADYVRSEAELVVEVEERMKEIRKLGLNEDYTKCPPGFTRDIRAYLDERYGGVEAYLRDVGVGPEKLDAIKRALLA